MDDDFALLDFALVAEPPAKVAQALAAALRPPEVAPMPSERRGRRLARILPVGDDAPILIQPRSSLPPTPIVRPVFEDLGLASEETVFRVSGPIQDTNLTLVEFRAEDDDRAHLCADLSRELRDCEVFYFRLSGARHPGAHCAFHVYKNGLPSRRTAVHTLTPPDANTDWESVDVGIFHPLENQNLASGGPDQGPIISPERQAAILHALGIEADTLFDGLSERLTVLVLSPAPGGYPVSEAASHGGAGIRRPASFSGDSGVAPVPLSERFREATPAKGIAPAPDISQVLAKAAPEPPAPTRDEGPSWETRVMAVLLDAVEGALHPDEQGPWIDGFTSRLNSGEVCEALAEAHVLIAYSERPEEQRLRLAAKLAALFAPAP